MESASAPSPDQPRDDVADRQDSRRGYATGGHTTSCDEGSPDQGVRLSETDDPGGGSADRLLGELEALQLAVERLEQKGGQDREILLAIVRGLADADDRLAELEQAVSPPAPAPLQASRKHLEKAVWALIGLTGVALYEALLSEEVYPRIKEKWQQWTERYRQRVRSERIEPEMIRIPAGWFWIGTDRRALEMAGIAWTDRMQVEETPYHQAYLPGYAIAKYPITNAQYAHFVDDGGYWTRTHWTPAGWEWKETKGWTEPRYCADPDYNAEIQPVVGVSWFEAVAYCRWLARATGTAFALPSEAEWEKAARGTDGSVWPWGNRWDGARCDPVRPWRRHAPWPVGLCSPIRDSPYGVADMAANVWQWTRSQVRRYPYNPSDGREDLEAGRDDIRVARGGSFASVPSDARCAFRGRSKPDRDWDSCGFRVVVSPIS